MRSYLLCTLTVLMLAGCGSTIKASMDDASHDGQPDLTTDGTLDPVIEPSGDTAGEPATDTGTDPRPDEIGPGQCSDGLDNDGDDLVDLEDCDCENPSDSPEGPGPEGCTMDNHCSAGWEECDHETGECYDPPGGDICDECESSADCGDGVMGEDPDRDWCIGNYYQWNCSKDCMIDCDCPRAFICDPGEDGSMPGYCVPMVFSCGALEVVGSGCSSEYDCWRAMPCHDGMCTYECETERECLTGYSCTGGWCLPD